jgi:hypothetical protein
VLDALERFPLLRVKNNNDRMLFDVDVWNKIAAAKGIPLPDQFIVEADGNGK